MPTISVASPVSVDVSVTERGVLRTELGDAIYLKIHAVDYRPLRWREIWEAFSELYPDRWAVECFPPASQLVDGKSVYHLFVLDHEPEGMNIR